MSNLESRLQECFATVFPDIAPKEIADTALETTPQWDSMATVILVTVLEEEFAITFDPSDFPRLTSYSSILEYLRSQKQDAVSGVQE